MLMSLSKSNVKNINLNKYIRFAAHSGLINEITDVNDDINVYVDLVAKIIRDYPEYVLKETKDKQLHKKLILESEFLLEKINEIREKIYNTVTKSGKHCITQCNVVNKSGKPACTCNVRPSGSLFNKENWDYCPANRCELHNN